MKTCSDCGAPLMMREEERIVGGKSGVLGNCGDIVKLIFQRYPCVCDGGPPFKCDDRGVWKISELDNL